MVMHRVWMVMVVMLLTGWQRNAVSGNSMKWGSPLSLRLGKSEVRYDPI